MVNCRVCGQELTEDEQVYGELCKFCAEEEEFEEDIDFLEDL